MFLFKRKIRGLSVGHPLGRIEGLPPYLTDEEAVGLTGRLRAGDWSACEAVVYGCMRLVISVAGQYATWAPGKVHDLVSEGLVTLVACCRKVLAGAYDGENVVPYAVKSIHGRLTNYLCEDKVIPVPSRTQSSRDYVVPVPRVLSGYGAVTRPGRGPGTMLELRELIDAAIHTEQEREVIRMREHEMVDREIAEAMGLSVSRVAQLRHGVTQRFLELEGAR